MQIRVTAINGSQKRWFGKVLTAAIPAINELTEPVGEDRQYDINAAFDMNESQLVWIVDIRQAFRRVTKVVFAAGRWTNLPDAIPLATQQLAGAAVALAPAEQRPWIESDFRASGIEPSPTATERIIVPDESRDEFYLHVDQHLDPKQFFELADRINAHLSKSAVGEVSGNSCSLDGTDGCIDLVASDRYTAQRAAKFQLESFGIKRFRFEP